MNSRQRGLAALALALLANAALAQLPFRAPSLADIPQGASGDSIRRGQQYLDDTARQLPGNTRAQMNCTSCHIDNGLTAGASPWIGIAARFPQYSARTAKMETLADRINDCFERSMNGTALPADSPAMADILDYMHWLSIGYPQGAKIDGQGIAPLVLDRPPDPQAGKAIFASQCAACHQPNGEGLMVNGKIVFPPLWGDASFNIAAGMARLYTAAGFVKAKMPQGQEGSLTDRQAWDVAAYFSQQPRPDFPGKSGDWPGGHKPADARY